MKQAMSRLLEMQLMRCSLTRKIPKRLSFLQAQRLINIANLSGQGAAMAFEDAATIGVLFSSIKDKRQIPDLLTIYETMRRPRVTEMHRRVKQVRDIYSMADGPKQQERDRQLREQTPFDGYPNFLADPVLQEWMFSHDAFKEAQKALNTFQSGEFPGTHGTWRLYV